MGIADVIKSVERDAFDSATKRKCGNCEYHDDFTGACFNSNSDHRADFTDNEFVCKCHAWNSLTVNEAVAIVRDELLKHGELYDGFLASVKSALVDYQKDNSHILNADCGVLAREILKRIVGK